MLHFGRTFGIALTLAMPSLAVAQDSPVVVELFTSQGCSSCPPADELLHELAQSEDVIPLALHVDYWDYIGWKDEFANPAFTERQQRYARQAGARSVFTPQFVISGVDHVVGAHPMEIMDGIRRHAAMQGGIDLTINRSGDDLVVAGVTTQSFARPLSVQLVRYMPEAEVDIERGENAGKKVTYSNIVTSWQVVGEWDGRSPLTVTVPSDGDAPAVVILQEDGPGSIVAAARVF